MRWRTWRRCFVRLCPRITILATSREVLRIEGEYVYRVPPLDVPATGKRRRTTSWDTARWSCSSPEQRRWTRTSRRTPKTWRRSPRSAGGSTAYRWPSSLPRRAPPRLGFEQVAAGLRDRFALLTGGRRTALPRHRTLRATLDWSYELLPEAERRLLRRLAVFPGGFTLDAAAAVMEDAGLDAAIGDRRHRESCLEITGGAGPDIRRQRWSLLETIRAYALEKLAECGEIDDAQRRHAMYFRDLFAPARWRQIVASDEDLARRVREIDNVRAALDWSFSASGDRRSVSI